MKDLNTLAIESGIMPILLAQEGCAERVVRAIERTEMPAVEILQRSETALNVLKQAIKVKKNALIGAGTVCTLDHCKEMVDLGADFIVTPGYSAEIVDWCTKHDVPVVPGVSSPTEIMMAANAGIKVAKFFPFYELGGDKFLKEVSGPFPDVKFLITGGLGDNDLHLLANHKIAAIGGTWMFQCDADLTVVSEDTIVDRMNYSLEISKHFRKGWE